jgi:hypothetical protein
LSFVLGALYFEPRSKTEVQSTKHKAQNQDLNPELHWLTATES